MVVPRHASVKYRGSDGADAGANNISGQYFEKCANTMKINDLKSLNAKKKPALNDCLIWKTHFGNLTMHMCRNVFPPLSLVDCDKR